MKPETTLAEVKTYLRDQFSDGCDCPACGQFVKLYNYKLFATSAWALIQLYKLHEKRPNEAYFHISEYAEAGEGRIRAPRDGDDEAVRARIVGDLSRLSETAWRRLSAEDADAVAAILVRVGVLT